MSQTPQAIKFEKVLWRKQPFEDNFVPTTFLCDLRTNSQLVLPEWAELAIASLRVSGRFLRVILFSLLFVHLHLGNFDGELLLLLTLFAFVVLSLVSSPDEGRSGGHSGKRGRKKAVGGVLSKVIMGLVLLAVSPVLRTLTESTTSDSIWAIAVVLFLIHLTLADYSSPNCKQTGKNLSDTLSFNAAISASVVLASRLDTNCETFTLLTLAILLFYPSTPNNPLNTNHITKTKTLLNFSSLYTITMTTAFTFTFTSQKSSTWLVLAWSNILVGFISIICPWWIRLAQSWKMEIKGPWDPAEPILSSSLHS